MRFVGRGGQARDGHGVARPRFPCAAGGWGGRLGWVLAALALTALWAPAVSGAAGAGRLPIWQPDGEIDTMAAVGSTLYIGGQFTYVGPHTGAGAPLSSVTGAPLAKFAQVSGPVWAAVSDGDGGWYIGGHFKHVGSAERSDLAHILADGVVDPDWDPGADGSVWALAVSGSTVYAGGEFTSVGGQLRQHIVAIDARSGQVTAWNPGANRRVNALAVSGPTVFAGGDFTSLGGQPRDHLAAIGGAGQVSEWNPGANRPVLALALSGAALYAGGRFTSIDGQARRHVAAMELSTGAVTAWNPDASATVWALAASGSTVYLGGDFHRVGGQPRRHLASVDATTGQVTTWSPGANGPVYAIAVSGSDVYAGGPFTKIGGRRRRCIAALDAQTGQATATQLNANNTVAVLAVSGSTVYVGGWFDSIGGRTRSGLAAIDMSTGEATGWNPNVRPVTIPDNEQGVMTMAVSGSTIYVGGSFTRVGGQSREGLAAVDAQTGRVAAWNPGLESSHYSPEVNAIAVSGPTVYVGGVFTSVGGQSRNSIAALDATTGLASNWNPIPIEPPDVPVIQSLVPSGSTVYVGGDFESIGGQPREDLAALDATTGQATGWDPDGQDGATALAVAGQAVYVGGDLPYALDTATGQTVAWDPATVAGDDLQGDQSTPQISALAVSGSIVYAGGFFVSVAGRPRDALVALDAGSGLPTPWAPDLGAPPAGVMEVQALAVSGSTLYAGGSCITAKRRACINLWALNTSP
jgi:predicted small secreted protein